jgi:PhnB protein
MGESDSFPRGYHSVNPYLIIGKVSEFIKFSESVFNAVVVKIIKEDKGMYAEIKIGDTGVMVKEYHKIGRSCSPSSWVYFKDVNATYTKALKEGCKSIQSPTPMYGVNKMAKVVDQFGIMWLIATFNAKYLRVIRFLIDQVNIVP